MTIHMPAVDETDTSDDDYTVPLSPECAVALGRLLTAVGEAATGPPTT